MKNKHESLVWVEDKNGDNHICYIKESFDSETRTFEQLSDEERNHCYTPNSPWS